MAHLERFSDFFDQQASFWRDLYLEEDVYASIHRERRGWALQKVSELALADDSVVLDAGMGAGGLATTVAEAGLRVVGVDASAGMLSLARKTVRDCDLDDRIVTVHADAEDLPFPDEAFPLVMALGLVPWVDDAGRLVKELARVTAAGGHVILNADNLTRLTHALDPLLNPRLARLRRAVAGALGRGRPHGVRVTLHTRSGFERLLADAGLEILEVRPLGFGPFTVAGTHLLPHSLARGLNRLLQRLADHGIPMVRSTGCQHLVLARRPA
ncbi:MAG TPA: methyltransferase domain-containing protein [Nocardioidaceae bacterium]|nr:methyltransferase domain-containing protein [Nocardioidaceae bacterium]